MSLKEQRIAFHEPQFSKEEEKELLEVLRSGWVTSGPKVSDFESSFKDFTKGLHAVAFNSCTASMHVALASWGIGPGDEVVTTPLTFCATIEAIEYVGATPVLADIDCNDGNLSIDEVAMCINPRTRVLLPVHYSGFPCELQEINILAQEHDLKVLEDAALAVGSMYYNKPIGSHSDAVAFSFYATKNISTGEGGMLTCKDKEYAEKCRRLSLHGMSKDAWKRYSDRGSWYYEIQELGFKYNMTDLAAALGLVQLEKVESGNARRREIADLYISRFSTLPFLKPFQWEVPSHIVHNRHLFPLVLDIDKLSISRNEFIERLYDLGVCTSVHYIPIHYHPYYKNKYGWKKGDFPNTEYLFERLISLPIYPSMTDVDVEKVASAVEKVGSENLVF